MGMYLGMALALCLSIIGGIGIPLIARDVLMSSDIDIFLLLIAMACALSVIFCLIAFLIAIQYDNKVKGLSIAIFVWLFFAIIYDGVFLLMLLGLKDYPLDKFTISMVVLNPIDLARIMILMKLDMSVMMGYTGAVLTKFLGRGVGMFVVSCSLIVWIIAPLWRLCVIDEKKYF
ncbi:MAG: Cu-processing system permease protein [Saprospiraceae bacterium]|jgi:Cu-processing system permease protein